MPLLQYVPLDPCGKPAERGNHVHSLANIFSDISLARSSKGSLFQLWLSHSCRRGMTANPCGKLAVQANLFHSSRSQVHSFGSFLNYIRQGSLLPHQETRLPQSGIDGS